MRFFLLAALFTLASCATVSDAPELEVRLASWEGAPIDGLADALGEPSDVSAEWREWRFTSPSMPSVPRVSSLTVQRCSGCDPNPATSAGHSTNSGGAVKTHSIAGATAIVGKECVYRAVVDNSIIVRIEVIEVSGRCRFQEIPLRG